MDFKVLKNNSKTSLSNLQKKLEETQQTSDESYKAENEEYWMPTLDKAGNGSGSFRFLPAPPQDGEDGLPIIKYWRHAFKGPGGWYIEKSRTSLGKNESDPVAEYNTKLWNTGIKENQDIARGQKRKLTYEANIEIISDPAKPELNGQIKKYRFGAKIYEKLEKAMAGEPGDEVTPAVAGFDPFDFWKGANFRLVVKKQGDYPNYDDSKFGPPTQHHGGDDKKLQEVWSKEYSLKAVVAPEKFKSYDDLKGKLNKVLGIAGNGESITEKPKTVESMQLPKNNPVKETKIDVPWEASSDSEGDEDLAYFQKLASELN